MEELLGGQLNEYLYGPHSFHMVRKELQKSYVSPDYLRMIHVETFNRKHRYKEHYMKEEGNDMTSMTMF